MNIRVVSLVLVVLVFALISGMISYSVSSGVSLKDAYASGKITVVQQTAAGTVPHQVMITNNASKSVKVKKGDVLSSTVSQDLVIAEDKIIASNSNATVKAYCLNPSQRAVVGAKLLPTNTTYSAITRVISSSNPSNSQSAMDAQLQIWIIASEGNLNPYTGEPVAVVDNNNITWSEFRQDIANAKSDVMSTFNVTESNIKNLNQTQSNSGSTSSWIDNTISWIKESI
ncbi:MULTISPECIES: ARPP-1 family domain-containing protein [Methanobacterium]|jgi:hypothetical protein|uniref:ARG and Rhodanese-Phosphatase-superfamily-associated domain-containing protein n=1 Tax=Methanobacterium veterum TaxID=408577 RepID=A0A9E5A274_9EURY|nr:MULTISPECIES: hypothetical protein [Methanobacterium]MCZ3364360.1 hypothetical protein [Methanobacterium veterum]MCZ3372110.1 hypothetical protein [Methanobacterium veterum]